MGGDQLIILWFFGHGPDGVSRAEERSIRLRAFAYVDEADPQTITEGVTVLDLLTATVDAPIYMVEGFALGPIDLPQNVKKQMEGNRR